MNKDLEISAISYTNKDFGTIYPEVLDLAKQLTNAWDPSQSNESDPGVVLLKEAAFIADHNNYNIDKNILENFLPSATQDKSVRNIVEMNGYTPDYYVSASGPVTFSWAAKENEPTPERMIIPAFTFVISDTDELVSYTQVEDLVLSFNPKSKSSNPASCRFIEGTLQSLIVNDSSTITLDNLDDNNRIYLPEIMVAQNGIYIRYSDTSAHEEYGYWKRNNYLLTQPNGSRTYKIDYDSSRGLPYIEFPTDIASIIEDGLQIQYISTSGESGNVVANTLTKIVSPSEFKDRDGNSVKSENFKLSNNSSILNGKDPETIQEMYHSFKRVVGTFDTLVSTRDYTNYIDKLQSYDGTKLVSNVIVTDRRTDYNKSLNLVTYDMAGAYTENISIKPCRLSFKGSGSVLPEASIGDMFFNTSDNHLYVKVSLNEWVDVTTSGINLNDFSILTEAMSPYDLSIYALASYLESDYDAWNPSKAYNASFKPVSENTLREIKQGVEYSKCICHTYNDPATDDIFCFKNYTPLKISIIPYTKIASSTETKTSIINNVYKAISEKFNPSKLEWGENLDILSLKSAIIESDERIRDVNISATSYTSAMLANSSADEVNIRAKQNSQAHTLFLDLISKNILAGRVCLFEFDEDFEFDYGQINGKVYSNISTISTEVPISVNVAPVNAIENSTNKSSRSTINSKGNDYKYILYAPNLTDSQGLMVNKLSPNMVYELKSTDIGTDSLQLQLLDASGNVQSTTNYEASNDTKITISSSVALENKQSKEFLVLPSCTLTISYTETLTSLANSYENLNYTLRPNEHIQIIYPNYASEFTYGMYVNYRFIGNKPIKANLDYELQAGDRLILIYNKDGVESQEILTQGDIVKTSFDLAPTDSLSKSGTKKSWVDMNGYTWENQVFKTLSSNQTISKQKLMTTHLKDEVLNCYWIVDNEDGALFESGSSLKILGTNEYFIYTNNVFNELVILGAGTKLTRTNTKFNWINSKDNHIAINSIESQGFAANIPWVSVDFADNPLDITEMAIINLSSGDNLKISGWSNPSEINNSWKTCDANIAYSSKDSTVFLPMATDRYQIRSRLDLNIGPKLSQKLLSGQHLKFVQSKLEDITNKEVKSSKELYLMGDNNINLSNYAETPIKLFSYDLALDKVSSTAINLDYKTNVKEFVSESGGTYNYKAEYPFYCGANSNILIPIKIDGKGVNITCKILSNGSPIEFKDFGNNSIKETSMTLSGNSVYFINPSTDVTERTLTLQLTWSISKVLDESESIFLDNLSVILGLNSLLTTDTSITLEETLNNINRIISNSDKPSLRYYLTYRPEPSMAINLNNYCELDSELNDGSYSKKAFDNPAIMWDINNVANHITINQIDINKSHIEIDSSFLK